MITIDKNMPKQTSLKGLALTILVLDAQSNAPPEVLSFASAILEALARSLPTGAYVWVRKDEDR